MTLQEKRRHQRQGVLLPLRVSKSENTGNVLYEGVTINVGAGGVYFRTYGWREFEVGTTVHVVIDVPPEMNQLLSFGGMTGRGTVVRVEDSRRFAQLRTNRDDDRPCERGVALKFASQLKFEPHVGMPVIKPDGESQDRRLRQ